MMFLSKDQISPRCNSEAPQSGEPGVHVAAFRRKMDSGFFASRSPRMKVLAAFLAVSLAACAPAQTPRNYDRDPSLPADLPFSSAVVVGKTIYLSGEIGRAPGGTTLVEGGVAAETRAIFENYKATLARLGADLSDIVKCTVFLDDMTKFAEMNAAYAAVFPEEKPARSTFGVDGLAMGASLEIECLAVKK